MARRRGRRGWLVQPDGDPHVLVLLFHHEPVVVAREFQAVRSRERYAARNTLETRVLVGVETGDLFLSAGGQRHARLGIEDSRL